MPELSEVEVKISTKADTKGIDEAEKRIGGFSQKTVQNSQMIAAGLLGVGVGLGALGVKAISTFGQVEQSQIAFTTLLGDQQKAVALVKQIQKDAAETPFEFQPLIDMNQKLIGAGMSAEVARKTVMGLGDALSATGAGTAEMSRIGNTISQVFGKGKADAVDFKELVNAGWVSVKRDTAETLGVSMAEFEDLVSEGVVNFEVLQKTLQNVTAEGGKFHGAMERQSQSVMGLWSTLKDNVNIALAEIGQELFNTFKIDEVLKGAIAGVAQFTDFLKGSFIPFLKENSGLIPIIAGTITALLIPAVVALGISIITALSPFTIIVIAIGLAVAALYLAWNNNFLGIRDIVLSVVEWFQTYVLPTLTSIFSFIGAVLTTLGQIFTNVWNFIIKPLLGLFIAWFKLQFVMPLELAFTVISKALEKMGLTWSDVWEGIKKIVFGILGAIVNEVKSKINFVIDAINLLIKGANTVGGKIPGYTKINEIPKLASGTRDFAGGLAWVGERGPELVNLPRGADVIPNNQINNINLPRSAGNASPVSVPEQRPIEIIQNIQTPVDLDFMFRELAFTLRTS